MQNEKISFSSMFSKFTDDWWISCAKIYKSYLHSHFLLTHVIGNIVIIRNCFAQIYKCMVIFSLQLADWKYYN